MRIVARVYYKVGIYNSFPGKILVLIAGKLAVPIMLKVENFEPLSAIYKVR